MEMSADITPIRQLQSQLESIGLLISSVSHGIKGLLNGLNGGMYLVNKGLQTRDQPRVIKGWEMVQRNIERIRSMVLDILYYAKDREPALAAGRGTWAGERGVRGDAGRRRASSASRSRRDVDGRRRASSRRTRRRSARCWSTCRELRRRLPGGHRRSPAHAVTLRVGGCHDHVRFEIEDNGIGMERETREKAFTPVLLVEGLARARGSGCSSPTRSHGRTTGGSGSNPSLKRGPVLL